LIHASSDVHDVEATGCLWTDFLRRAEPDGDDKAGKDDQLQYEI